MATKIHELRAKKANILAQMKTLQAKDATDDGMSADEAVQFNGLGDSLLAMNSRIDRHEAMLAAEAEEAKSAKSDEDDDSDDEDDEKQYVPSNVKAFKPRNGYVPAEAKATELKDGSRAIQMMLAKAYDGLPRKSGDRYKSGAAMIKATYGESEVTKALAATGTAANGAILIPQTYIAELISFLRSKVVMRQIGAFHMEMPTGNARMPRQTATTTAQWQGEQDDILTSVPAFADMELLARKATAMSPITNDLIRRSPIAADEVLRRDLSAQLARLEDLAFLRGTGGNQPTGLRNLALPGNVFVAGAKDANSVLDFLVGIINAVEVGNVDLSTGVWVMRPDVKNFLVALRNGLGYPYFQDLGTSMTLLGYPVFCTTQLPNNLTSAGGTAGSEIYFVPASEFVIADSLDPIVEVSREASFLDVGTNTLISAWSKDLTVFRVIEEVDCNIFHPQAIGVGLVDSWIPANG